jgi:hypothetical protein
MSKWSSYKGYQQLHEGWRRFLNEAAFPRGETNGVQICAEWWKTVGGGYGRMELNDWVVEANDLGIENNGFEDAAQGGKLVLMADDNKLQQFSEYLARKSRSELDEVMAWYQPYVKGKTCVYDEEAHLKRIGAKYATDKAAEDEQGGTGE